MKILVTGCAGFIGMHVSQALLARGDEVVGIDNLNAYYDVSLKEARLERLLAHPAFTFQKLDVADAHGVTGLFARHGFARVVHLAAQAGVRYSLVNPHAYTESNVQGFLNMLEACRHHPVSHLVYASTSSVYGGNRKLPFSEEDRVDHPVSLYAATKKANELMAHTYSHLFRVPATGLRFFTVYGPWGRPDMALFLFTRAMLAGEPIQVFNQGRMVRDFTYVDDVARGVVATLDHPPAPCAETGAPHAIYNIGNHQPVELLAYIEALEKALGLVATKEFLPMQPGDVPATYADTTRLAKATGFAPDTPVADGVRRFVDWYRAYYRV